MGACPFMRRGGLSCLIRNARLERVPEIPRNAFAVTPRRVARDDWLGATWSVYLIRVALDQHGQDRALKVGMVGSGTIEARMRDHARHFGRCEILSVWTVAHGAGSLDEVAAWRLTEQYEARLQFAPEFRDPSARLCRLRPDTLVYSYEWFADDERVIHAIEEWAESPVTLPHGWDLANEDASDPIIRQQPRQ
jgi:hypothetical protein